MICMLRKRDRASSVTRQDTLDHGEAQGHAFRGRDRHPARSARNATSAQVAREVSARGQRNFSISGTNNNHISVVPSSGKINSFIKIESPAPYQTGGKPVAISVNNKIAAVLPEMTISGDKNFVYTMLDEKLLSAGKNSLSIITLITTGECNSYIMADL